MRKEEDENTPGLGPIEDYLHAVATERKLPSLAVGICTLRIEDAAPKLRACWTGQRTARSLSDDEGLLLFRRIHIPGAARDSQACRPILRSLRLPFQDLDDLLGDAVTERMAKIVAGVFDGDTDALFALMIDSSIDGFIRAR